MQREETARAEQQTEAEGRPTSPFGLRRAKSLVAAAERIPEERGVEGGSPPSRSEWRKFLKNGIEVFQHPGT